MRHDAYELGAVIILASIMALGYWFYSATIGKCQFESYGSGWHCAIHDEYIQIDEKGVPHFINPKGATNAQHPEDD